MRDNEEFEDDLEEELENALKANENKRNVFSIIRNEKESLNVKERPFKKS